MRFLAHWHGLLCEHLPQRIQEPERRAALMTLADRLNPAGWVDADEIAAGLQRAGEALEQLSRVLAKRRRKNRRSGRDQGARREDADAPPESGDDAPEMNPAGDSLVEDAAGSRDDHMVPSQPATDMPSQPASDEPDPA
jgi:hypothetical protein